MDFKFIIAVLILILVLAVAAFAFMQTDSKGSNINETSDDVAYIWMEDDDGSVKLVPTTDTYFEGSASAQG